MHRMLTQDMAGSWTFQASLTQNGSKCCYSFIIAVVICIIMQAGSFWGHFFEERLKLPQYLGIFLQNNSINLDVLLLLLVVSITL